MPPLSFIAAASLGAAIWAGAAILMGWLMRAQLQTAVERMSRQGTALITVVAIGLCVWLAWKLWQKHRFERLAAIPHTTAAELMAALASDAPPLLLDFRAASLVAQTGPLAGATRADMDDLARAVSHWPKHRPIVTMCACPDDATAVRAARALAKLGYTSVRPLRGGYETWIRELEQHAA
jgi:rhodanese-related sulfurtransferase